MSVVVATGIKTTQCTLFLMQKANSSVISMMPWSPEAQGMTWSTWSAVCTHVRMYVSFSSGFQGYAGHGQNMPWSASSDRVASTFTRQATSLLQITVRS